jgi:nucleotide-binding universal stress UspA family protein
MLKSLLLALDGSPGSIAARAFARDLALMHRASIRGLAVVDAAVVTPPEPTPIGADTYKQHKDAVILERIRRADTDLAQSFLSDCAAAGVAATADVERGGVEATMNAACAPHDLVVLGSDIAFGAEVSAAASLIAALLRDNPRPLIVVPPAPRPGTRTLVAYDGSVPAMRAIQLFAALRLRESAEVTVASVRNDPAEAESLAKAGADFLNARGYVARPRPVSGSDPAPALIKAAQDADAGFMVAGAYGSRGWREWLLGSTTEHLLAASPVPLFIHH